MSWLNFGRNDLRSSIATERTGWRWLPREIDPGYHARSEDQNGPVLGPGGSRGLNWLRTKKRWNAFQISSAKFHSRLALGITL
jgi:hypothetical protein